MWTCALCLECSLLVSCALAHRVASLPNTRAQDPLQCSGDLRRSRRRPLRGASFHVRGFHVRRQTRAARSAGPARALNARGFCRPIRLFAASRPFCGPVPCRPVSSLRAAIAAASLASTPCVLLSAPPPPSVWPAPGARGRDGRRPGGGVMLVCCILLPQQPPMALAGVFARRQNPSPPVLAGTAERAGAGLRPGWQCLNVFDAQL